MLKDIWDWLLVNPARILVLISMYVTWWVGRAEWFGRRLGGSGWVTLARLGVGAISSLVTAVIAGLFGGIGAFFGYLLIQIVVTLVIPFLWAEHMPSDRQPPL